MDVCVLIAVYAAIKGNDYTHIIYKKYTSEQTNPHHKLSVLKKNLHYKVFTTKMYDVNFPILCGTTYTTRLTTIPGYSCHHRIRQHFQCNSLQKSNPYRSIPSLGQQSLHNSQTECMQHIGTKGKDSVFNTGITKQGTTTHQNSIAGLPVSKLGTQPMAPEVPQQQPT